MNIDLLLFGEMKTKSIVLLFHSIIQNRFYFCIPLINAGGNAVQAKFSGLLLFILHFLVVVSLAHECLQLILMTYYSFYQRNRTFKNMQKRVGETTPQARALVAPAEDPDSVSSIHMGVTAAQNEFQGIQYLLLTSVGIRHAHGTHT